MSASPEMSGSHLRGVSRLAFDAVAGMIGLVETMHAAIARHSSLLPPREGKTRGITRLVYRSIRGVTHLTGASVDAALALLDPILTVEPTSGQEAARAALNGVLGDHLAETIFLNATRTCAEARPRDVDARMRMNVGCFRLSSPIFPLPSWTTPIASLMVNRSSPRRLLI